jgi:Lon protease-like protein
MADAVTGPARPGAHRLPMFPLQTVLFPGQALPLHVFEPRYQELTRVCLAGDRRFGVVLIERGSEVGGGDTRFDTGTVAEIAEAEELEGGRFALLAVGVSRARVVRWLPDDPYPAALVEEVADAEPADRGGIEAARRAVRRALAILAELGLVGRLPVGLAPADPEAALWRLCALAPVGPLDRQRLLEAATGTERAALLCEVADQAAEILAHRLSGGP